MDYVLEKATQVADEHGVAGVITFDEMFTPLTARIADALQVPGFGVDAVENCRDKLISRQVLRHAGLTQPVSEYAATASDALAISHTTGFPLVLKPRGMAGSIGVLRVDTPEELSDAFEVVRRAAAMGAQRHGTGALVEQMVVGEEVSIDSAVRGGKVDPLFVARKRFGPAPYFEETGQTIDAEDPLLTDPQIVEVLERAHLALGVNNGVTHTEIKLSPDGPVIIEVNSRPGGDFVPHTAELATGLEVGNIAAQIALGGIPRTQRTRTAVAANAVLYPETSGTVRQVNVPAPQPDLGVVEAAPLVSEGATVLLPPDGYMTRYAYVLVSAPTPRECATRLSAAVEACALEMEPA
ncbi:MAG: ATP-grasp domain-containing protein [Candidatus Microbacterium colombiense]|nr:MAG: ATP-grasp domain-containing protein [Microbacterium sp.]